MSYSYPKIPFLTFRRLLLPLAGFFLPLLALGAWLRGKRRLAGAAFATSNALLLYPTLMRNCSLWGKIITHFETSHREVWLTIDDGPDPNDTPKILDLLDRYRAKASFFCIGKKVEKYPDLCRNIINRGHTIENHSYHHHAGAFWALPPRSIEREIRQTSHAIRVATGVSPHYFRSPAGMTNPFVHQALEKNELLLTGWSCSGFDGINRSPRAVLNCLLPAVMPGAIILIHEGSSGNTPSQKIHTLELLLQYLNMQGYICTLPPQNSLRS